MNWKIERITQLNRHNAGSDLHLAYAINYVEHENAKYFNPSNKQYSHSGGWSKDSY